MITFRPKPSKVVNLMKEARTYLDKEGIPYKVISPKEADAASKVNWKSMVLMEFIQNENGYYQIQVKDKEFYSYTRKLLGDLCSMRILDVSQKDRTVTAETDHLGIALDVISILGTKNDLSIVDKK
jgi:hypothetical protein